MVVHERKDRIGDVCSLHQLTHVSMLSALLESHSVDVHIGCSMSLAVTCALVLAMMCTVLIGHITSEWYHCCGAVCTLVLPVAFIAYMPTVRNWLCTQTASKCPIGPSI
jgi:hypothetical protein